MWVYLKVAPKSLCHWKVISSEQDTHNGDQSFGNSIVTECQVLGQIQSQVGRVVMIHVGGIGMGQSRV